MNVQTTQGRRVQHPLRQDQTVGGDDHGLCAIGDGLVDGGFACQRFVGKFAIQTQAARLGDGDVVFDRELLDGRGLQFHATARRPVGLAEDQGDLMAGGDQLLHRHPRKLRRAGEDKLHSRALSFKRVKSWMGWLARRVPLRA